VNRALIIFFFLPVDGYFRYGEDKYSGNPAIPSQPISYSTALEILKYVLFSYFIVLPGTLNKCYTRVGDFSLLRGNTQNTVPYCQKYTPKDCFFGDFARWVSASV